MQSKKSHSVTCVVLGIMLSFWMMSLTGAAAGQEQELKTLKLVNTYQSEAEFQAANPEKFSKRNIIREKGGYIEFVDIATRAVQKQIKKEEFVLTEAEKQRLNAPDNTSPLIKNYTAYTVTNDNMFLIQTDFTYIIHSLSDAMGSTETNVNQNILYSAQGNVITTLPPEVFDIILSPDQQHFIA